MLAVEKRSAEFEVGAAAARGAGEGLAAAAGATGAGAPPIAFAMASAYERPAATAAESDRCMHTLHTHTLHTQRQESSYHYV